MNKVDNIIFRKLSFNDIGLICKWFNAPHVKNFYSLRQWTEPEVREKLSPYITGHQPVHGFIIVLNNRKIGYVQHYTVKDYPWPNQSLSEDIIEQVAGMDFFIGESDLIGKGFATIILHCVLEQLIWPHYRYCIVDPDCNNKRMIRVNEKNGFKKYKIIHSHDALKRPVTLQLMMLERPTDQGEIMKYKIAYDAADPKHD